MKKHILIFIALLGTLSACTSDQQNLVWDLDNTWQIVNVTFERPALSDTTVVLDESYIVFYACNFEEGDCDGDYQINNLGQEDLFFNADVVDGKKTIHIEAKNPNTTYVLSGDFLITELSTSKLTMEAMSSGNLTGFNIPYSKMTIHCLDMY